VLECGYENSICRQNLSVALGFLVTQQPKSVSVQNSSLAAIALLQCVERGGPQQQTAISLLAERFDLFSPFLADKMSLLHKLFYSSLPVLQLGSLGIQQQQELRKTVDPISIEFLAALASVANNNSKLFVRFVTESLYNPQHSSFAQLNAVISSINPVIQRHPACLIPHLFVLCSSLLKVLDPHFSQVRDACIQGETCFF